MKRYTAPDGSDWNIESPVMLSHQRHPRGNPLIRTYMERDFREPKDFASFLYVGQVLQGIVIKYARRGAPPRAWATTGAACTGSSTTAGRSPRGPASTTTGAGRREQYFARKFFAPVLVSPVDREGRRVDLRRLRPARRRARAPDRAADRLRGQPAEAVRSEHHRSPANASRAYMTFKESDLLKGADPTKVVLVTELHVEGAPTERRRATCSSSRRRRTCSCRSPR